METKSIGFIGGGRITRIFLVAFKNAAVTFDHVPTGIRFGRTEEPISRNCDFLK